MEDDFEKRLHELDQQARALKQGIAWGAVLFILLIVYALPQLSFHITLQPWVGAAVGLTLWGSAQVAEATRGAIPRMGRGIPGGACLRGGRRHREPRRVWRGPPVLTLGVTVRF